jgi:hypothetical protein
MAVEKRTLDQTYVNARNVRARLFYELHPQPKCTPILRRKRLLYTKSLPLFPIQTTENILESPSGRVVKVITPCKNRIRFHNKVSVIRIPSREMYPESIKKNIWRTLQEISENARRNTIEFAADRWDWRRATEDEAMYVAPNGERIHPVHVRLDFTQKRRADV